MKESIKLHRAGRRSDWSRLKRRRWNGWQKLAGATGGVVTPGNIFSIVGLAMVFAGLAAIYYDAYLPGLALVAAGRCCDLVDGWLAERTGTKSPLGEKIDSTADKLAIGAAGIVLVAAGLVPWPAAISLVLSHAAISLLAAAAVSRQVPLHPSRLGKLAMAVAWLGLLVFVADAAMKIPSTGAWYAAAYGICLLAAAMAAWTAVSYYRLIYGRGSRQV